jgi:putative tryptophan/tyrosine transport system substrate-binding protein
VQQHADALLVHVDALFNDGRGQEQVVALAGQHRLPSMMGNATFTARGGLISYGADTSELNRQAGVYVARILRGEKPADLPVVQPTIDGAPTTSSVYGTWVSITSHTLPKGRDFELKITDV